MKKYQYSWDKDIFLLHVQFNNLQQLDSELILHREYEGGKNKREVIAVKEKDSFRFIISRTHPKESRFELEYPKGNTIEVYKVDDRAYYPTEAFFVG